MVWMTLWWVIGIGLLVLLVWFIANTVRPAQSSETPEAILRRRYAAGEIDTEEFERRLATLRKAKDAA
jgi:putative membrane protein